jgi:hypothetical protein
LGEDVAEALYAATGVEFVVTLPTGSINWMRLDVPDGVGAMSPESVVDLVLALDALHQGSEWLTEVSERIELVNPAWPNPGAGQFSLSWYEDSTVPGGRGTRVGVWPWGYSNALCRLPNLVELVIVGEGSDFINVSRCTPFLHHLRLTSWAGVRGADGLRDLASLRYLAVESGVETVEPFLKLTQLKGLDLNLAFSDVDSLELHKQIMEALPGCSVSVVVGGSADRSASAAASASPSSEGG